MSTFYNHVDIDIDIDIDKYTYGMGWGGVFVWMYEMLVGRDNKCVCVFVLYPLDSSESSLKDPYTSPALT